ncbi:MAG: molecular chaperone DnaK [Lachnospiraceae bacterium]|nr:molecular chaperone DnaK [Candidatus Merdinaster equi]
MGKAIGIDLGTTNSCVAVFLNGEPCVIPNQAGTRTTPSIVAFTPAGERLIGDAAARQAVVNSSRTISSIKRQMGTEWSIRIDGNEYKPQTISALILKQLKEDAESYLGEKVTDAVITVPAYFDDTQRQATKDAGRIAGLNVLRIINEPTSAALSYGLDHGESQKVLVYDLGGGTFDVSVIDICDGVIEVLATAGDNHLGGDDFDKRLADYLIKECKKQTGADPSKDFMARQRILDAAQAAKKELSSTSQTQINLPYLMQDKSGPIHLDITVTRAVFEELIRDLVDRTAGPVNQALSDAGIKPSQLGKVLLVGGSTRIPAVQAKVKSLVSMEPSKNINPDECVAVGACILASNLQGNALTVAGGNNLLLMDVTPMSLSIETMGGVSTVLIERNSTIPTRYSKVFTTAGPYQSTVDIHVLQGERPMARDNKQIGKFRLKGIRKAPAGVPQIEVTFDIDADGILNVSAKDLDTGAAQSIVITSSERMSDAEIQKAMQDAAEYKGVDETRKLAIELAPKASQLLNEAQNYLTNNKKTMDKDKKRQLKDGIVLLQRKYAKFNVSKVTPEQVNDLQAAMDEMRKVLD